MAYRQLREKFIGAFKRNPNYEIEHKKSVLTIILQAVLFFLLPWIRNQSKKPFEEIDFSAGWVWRCFVFTNNPVIRVAQGYLLLYAVSDVVESLLECSERSCIS